MKRIIIWLVLIGLVIVVFVYFANKNQNNNVATSTQENEEQKLIDLVTKNWMATTSNEFTFKYPADLGTKYIQTVDWPPILNVENKAYSCNEGGDSKVLPAGMTREQTIDSHSYCVTIEEEGAAGSVYTNYAYAFPYQNQTIIMTFTMRRPQCMNYDDPKQSECLKEEQDFNISPIVDTIVQTINKE